VLLSYDFRSLWLILELDPGFIGEMETNA